MHGAIILASLFAGLGLAAPASNERRAAASAIIKASLGNGDDATQFSVDVGTLSTTVPSSIALALFSTSGINVQCQAFKDAAGTITLGTPFDLNTDASFGSTAVTVGSLLCAEQGSQTSGSISNSTTTAAAPAATNGNDSSQSLLITAQLDNDDTATTFSPVLGQLFTAVQPIVSLVLSEAPSGATCQVFSDVAGKQAIGGKLSLDTNVVLSATPVNIGSILCESV